MKKFSKLLVIIIFLCNFICITNISAETINAVSCSQLDVQSAIDSANDGDTIFIPAGNCTWESTVYITKKQIIIEGKGIDSTNIVNAIPATGWKDSAFWISSEEGKPFRISGIAFKAGPTGGDGHNGVIYICGTCKNWRLDHCKFDSLNNSPVVKVSDYTFGVIDHCTFIHKRQAIQIDHDIWGGDKYGDGSWKSPLTFGTEKAVYIEDCTFNYIGSTTLAAIDSYAGARVVFRYNTFANTHVLNHGTDTSNRSRSARSYEIYENTFSHSGSYEHVISFRGGTAVVFNNTSTGNFQYFIIAKNFRCPGSACDIPGACEPWDFCNGDSIYDGNEAADSGIHTERNDQLTLVSSGKNWFPSEWVGYMIKNITDGSSGIITANDESSITATLDNGTENNWDIGDNFVITNGWPCLDQVGRSTDSGLGTQQALEPLYEWNNTLNGVDGDIYPRESEWIKENRDFYNDTQKPGYTPYKYPHPLTQTTMSDLVAPSNVRIVNVLNE